jgi:phosphoribosylformylglycinamidine synthase subunit PurQ / glutaminase
LSARVGIVLFPGTNCELDVAWAVERLGGTPEMLWHAEAELRGADAVVVPGGFAHGDYLRTGAIARFSPVMDAVARFAAAGGPVVGICNGFQVLTEAGMLPGALLRNRSLSFVCHDVHLRVENSQTIFTCGYEAGQAIRVPVAHGEGNYTADEATLDRLEGEDRVAFRYCSPAGDLTDEDNVNGSARCIAGVFNETRTVLGLMPHPENSTDPLLGCTDGQGLFDGLVSALQ